MFTHSLHYVTPWGFKISLFVHSHSKHSTDSTKENSFCFASGDDKHGRSVLRPVCIKEDQSLEPAETCSLIDTHSFQDFRKTLPTTGRDMSRQEGLTSQQLQLTGSCLSPTGGKHVTKQSERERKRRERAMTCCKVSF